MKTFLLKKILLLSAAIGVPASAQQLAITEFFANPTTVPDAEGEFVELFNYGSEVVNLNGWAISDEDNDSDIITDTDLFMNPGTYLILAKNKSALESAFFGGTSRADIIDMPGLTLANGGDEIILSEVESSVIWSIAYPGGAANGNAAFLSEDLFATTVWGSKSSPGIDFSDDDPASGTLGYQNNNVTTDSNAITNDDGNTASPLAGFYTSGGTAPDDGNFRILSIVPGSEMGSFDITFTSDSGNTYALDQSSDLTDGSFIQVETSDAPATPRQSPTTPEPSPTPSTVFARCPS